MNAMKLYFQFLDVVNPKTAARKMFHLMSNPQVRKLRDFEEAILNQAIRKTIPFQGFEIQTYEWGSENEPTVLLVHGWEGQAGNFGALIEILLKKKYRIISFDAPAHGHSSKGNTSMFASGFFLQEFIKKERPKIIISHSFGSPNTGFGLKANSDLQIDQWIMVTTPFKFQDRLDQMKKMLGITDRTINQLKGFIKKDSTIELEALNMVEFSKHLQQVKKILIVHSKADSVLPIQGARKAHQALTQSELIELEDLGHYRILWSEDLKTIIEERL